MFVSPPPLSLSPSLALRGGPLLSHIFCVRFIFHSISHCFILVGAKLLKKHFFSVIHFFTIFVCHPSLPFFSLFALSPPYLSLLFLSISRLQSLSPLSNSSSSI